MFAKTGAHGQIEPPMTVSVAYRDVFCRVRRFCVAKGAGLADEHHGEERLRRRLDGRQRNGVAAFARREGHAFFQDLVDADFHPHAQAAVLLLAHRRHESGAEVGEVLVERRLRDDARDAAAEKVRRGRGHFGERRLKFVADSREELEHPVELFAKTKLHRRHFLLVRFSVLDRLASPANANHTKCWRPFRKNTKAT